MMTDNELNNLLNDFLSDSKADNDEQFVQSVMASLPPEPKFMWVRDIFPAVVFFFSMLALWKFKILTPAVVVSLITQGLTYLQSQWLALNPTTGIAVLLGAFGLVCYYAYETFAEI